MWAIADVLNAGIGSVIQRVRGTRGQLVVSLGCAQFVEKTLWSVGARRVNRADQQFEPALTGCGQPSTQSVKRFTIFTVLHVEHVERPQCVSEVVDAGVVDCPCDLYPIGGIEFCE